MAGVHTPCVVALHGAFLHFFEGGHLGPVGAIVAGNLWPPVVTVIVFDSSVFAIPFLQRRHHELRLIRVIAIGIGLAGKPVGQGITVGGVRPLQICRLLVYQHAHVGCTLNVRLAA